MRRLRAMWALLFATLLSGCGSDQWILLAPAAQADERSALVATREGNDALELYATPVSEPIRFEGSGQADLEIEWLFFAETLDALHLSPGPVPRPPPGQAGHRIRGWTRAFETTASGDAHDWRSIDSISDALAERELPGEDCSALNYDRAQLVDIGAHEQGRFVEVIDADRLFVATSGPPGSYVVHKDGRVEPISIRPDLDLLYPHDSARETDGTIWLAYGARRTVHRVTFDGSVLVEDAPEMPDDAMTIAVELEGDGRTQVFVGSETTLYRLGQGEWSQVQAMGGSGNDALLLDTDGPNHSVVSAETSSISVHFLSGRRTEHRYPPALVRPRALAFAAPLGLLVGTQESDLWRFDPTDLQWEPLEEFGLSDVASIVEHGDGFVVGFRDSPEIAEYRADRGFCALARTPIVDSRHVRSWGDELVVMSRRTAPSTGLQLLRLPLRD